MIDLDKLTSEFRIRFGGTPRLFRAPGRVNLIGEHTDYNEGFVLPAALNFATYVAGRSRKDRCIRVASLNFEGGAEFDLDDPVRPSQNAWARYVQGVALILERKGFVLRGADLLIDSDVPVGAGLSSSAALEVSTAFALAALSGHQLDGMDLARIGQSAEHEFAGVRSGIMDQFASVFGKAGHALFLDCQSLEWSAISVSHAQFLICNTKTKHDLAESEYNKRRAECEAAAAFLGHSSLRGASLTDLADRSDTMDATLHKRARHIVTENMRVLSSVEALRMGDLATFGTLMNESHQSLRDDFEVSSRELDLMVEIAQGQNRVLGSRMTGGGFGGCTINLVEKGGSNDIASAIAAAYRFETGSEPEIYLCNIENGVGEI